MIRLISTLKRLLKSTIRCNARHSQLIKRGALQLARDLTCVLLKIPSKRRSLPWALVVLRPVERDCSSARFEAAAVHNRVWTAQSGRANGDHIIEIRQKTSTARTPRTSHPGGFRSWILRWQCDASTKAAVQVRRCGR
jgi:hypothetical protein